MKGYGNMPMGHDSLSKGIRQMNSYFDVERWNEEQQALKRTEKDASVEERPFTRKEIKMLIKRKEEVKKKQKYGWLYKN